MTTHIPWLTLSEKIFAQPALSILFPVVIGIGSGFAANANKTPTLYKALKKPPLAPPGWLFGPVWTVLYTSMGYAACRAWSTGMASFSPNTIALTKHGATLYTIQFGLNQLFTPLFFDYERPVLAAVDIVALTGAVGYLTYIWSQVDKLSAWLLAPYLAWLSFATYICIGVGYLNNWNFSNKVKPKPSAKGAPTQYTTKNL